MSKKVYLVDALKNDSEMFRKYINLKFDTKVATFNLKQGQTGWNKDQVLKAEKLNLHPILINKEIFLISEGSKFKLFLMGEAGAKNGQDILSVYSSLYSCKDLVTVSPLSHKIYNHLSEEFRKIVGDCWLNDKYKTSSSTGLMCSYNSKEMARGLSFYEYGKKSSNFFAFPISVVVKLPAFTMINIDNPKKDGFTAESALEIIIPIN